MVPSIFSLQIINCFLVIFLSIGAQAELFTAISEVEPLLVTHKRIIDDLEHYVQQEEKRLSTLKKHLSIYKKEHEKAMEDIPNYLGNPINAFTLIKRLTADLDNIEKTIKVGTEYIKNITMNHDDVKYPTIEDLAGAAQALTRLQETYHLNVSDLAEGVLNGVTYSTPMTAGDCFELGRTLYNEEDYKNALDWMLVTLQKYRMENIPYVFNETQIIDYISFSYYLLGDVENALKWTKKLVELEPNHARARNNIPHYQKAIQEEKAKVIKQRRGDVGDDSQQQKTSVSTEFSEFIKEKKSYEHLCRGEMGPPTEIAKKLHCRYLSENHPFLKLAPFKMEYAYLKPDIVIFHDVMSDDEIKFIQEAAKPRFKRAVVHDPRTGNLVPAPYRISKSAWLKDEESPVIARVSRRVADMTGLSMASAEELQVVNYGIGGHYEPHYDFARVIMSWAYGLSAEKLQVVNYDIGRHYEPHYDFARREENAFKKFDGNRIATVLFYMSEVAQGGATVFTKLGVSLFPIKGAAAFWLNLHPSGEGDLATRHAACPVLRGSKWVSNKWLHQGGQEFIKPCDLEYQGETIIRAIPKPVPKTSR